MSPRKKTSAPEPTSEPTPESAPDWNYEITLAEVAAIVDRLETGELPLGEVFDQFQRAVQALNQCEQFLQEKQAQADLLIETLTDD